MEDSAPNQENTSSWFVKARRAASVDDYETWQRGGVCPTLNAFDNATETRATVVAVAHAFYSTGGGHGLNSQPEISPPIKVGSALGIPSPPAVAYGFSHYSSDPGAGKVSPTLRSGTNVSGHAVAYDEFNDSTADIHHTLRAGTRQATGAIQGMKVRRLTPRECERLQGFPDDWTRVNDKTADSHRYKQMGNAVTVNVAHYIAELINSAVKEQP